MAKLTAVQVRNAKPTEKPYKLTDSHGLYLHIAESGKKTWRYRYRIAGKESTFVMGEYPQMSLEDARRTRTEAREQVKAGINPAQERRTIKQETIANERATHEAKGNSFELVALDWINQQKERWSRSHAKAVRATLELNAFPILGRHPVDTITPPMVLQVVRSIENRDAVEMAHKVLQRVNAVLRFAVQTGLATYNPAAEMKGVLKTRKVVHRAALTRGEMPEFLRTLRTADIHITTKLALEFTILTAARTGEVRGATWDEINLDDAIWRIPAQRMKMASPHNVPLSRQAMAILERTGHLYGQNGLVFPGTKNQNQRLSENTMLFSLYRMGYHTRATVHGFRAVFSTIANESGFEGDVIEKALAHEERNRVRAAYHRSEYLEQRRALMQWWANLLDELEAGAEIIPIKSA
ncbi:MAG: integrase arm-type DNA-binding domain-containing protein [Desulfobulbaceae bacterium]|nr:integrase arm-type DNA-binding domain-containing protein [Desulfobulbaceae bacterium]